MAPFIQNKGEDQKKGLRCKTSWFSVRKYVMPKKKEKKGLCLQISGFSVSKEKKTQIVSPQNGDTRGDATCTRRCSKSRCLRYAHALFWCTCAHHKCMCTFMCTSKVHMCTFCAQNFERRLHGYS